MSNAVRHLLFQRYSAIEEIPRRIRHDVQTFQSAFITNIYEQSSQSVGFYTFA
jgi:hypothetical protein